MSLDLTAVLGLIAGCLTTVSLVPQAWKVWRSRSAKDISLKMFIAFASGVSLWLVYGVMIGELRVPTASGTSRSPSGK